MIDKYIRSAEELAISYGTSPQIAWLWLRNIQVSFRGVTKNIDGTYTWSFDFSDMPRPKTNPFWFGKFS